MPADPQQVHWFIRFWEKVDQGEADECWPWTASTDRYGYGQFHVDGRSLRAHRVSYELANGAIPEGRLVMHTCDNPPCVNPAHLVLGTAAENMQDKVRKGRQSNGRERRTHCPKGHPLDVVRSCGRRKCRGCGK